MGASAVTRADHLSTGAMRPIARVPVGSAPARSAPEPGGESSSLSLSLSFPPPNRLYTHTFNFVIRVTTFGEMMNHYSAEQAKNGPLRSKRAS